MKELERDASIVSKYTLQSKDVFPQGKKFVLHGGKKSEFYVDLKTTPSEPEDLVYITSKLYNMLLSTKKAIIVGIELGGSLYLTALATYIHAKKYKNTFEYVILRKPKSHGNPRRLLHVDLERVERHVREGYEIILLDDVVVEGDTFEEATDFMRNDHGWNVNRIIAIHKRSSLLRIDNIEIEVVLQC